MSFRRLLVAAASTFVLLIFPTAAFADACDTGTTKTFVDPAGTPTNAWSDANNWSPAGVPTSSDVICVPIDSTIDVELSVAGVAFSGGSHILNTSFGTTPQVTVRSGAAVTQTQLLWVNNGQNFTVAGSWTAAAGIPRASNAPGTFTIASGGSFATTAFGNFTVDVPFVNAGSFTYSPTTNNSTATLTTGGATAHTGAFNINGAATGTRISFSGTHSLNGATLNAANPAGSYDMVGAISYMNVTKNAALTLNGGSHVFGATPFAGGSLDKVIDFASGGITGDFTIPDGWTFNQNNTLWVDPSQDITNEGIWNAAANISIASSAPGVFTNAATTGIFHVTRPGNFVFEVPFVNAGLFTYAPTTNNSTATLSRGSAAPHSGTFDIQGAATGATISFIGTHTLSGAALNATNANGGYDMAGTITYSNVTKQRPLTFSGGSHTLGATPFATNSPNKVLNYASGTLVGDFTIPDGWTFNQNNTLWVDPSQDITNEGIWNAAANISIASSAPGVFTNAATTGIFHVTTASNFVFEVPFVNAGLFTYAPTTNNSTATLSRGSAAAHSGTFDIQGAATGPAISFIGTHSLSGAALNATNANGGYDMAGTITYSNVTKQRPLTFSGGSHTLGATPFATNSPNKVLNYASGTLVGDFTIPSGWTFNQNNTLWVDPSQDIVNAGTWNAAANINIASSAPGVFTNAATTGIFHVTTASNFVFDIPFVNAGLFTYAPTTNNSTATLQRGDAAAASGTFDIQGAAAGARIDFAGTHNLNGATLNATNAQGKYASSASLNGSSLTVNAPIDLTSGGFTSGALTLSGTGGVVSATGTTLGTSGLLTINNGVTLSPTGTLDLGARDVSNKGAIQVPSGVTLTGSGTLDNRKNLTNVGTPGGVAIVDIPVTTATASRISANNGTLRLKQSINSDTDTLGVGTWLVGTAGTLQLDTLTGLNDVTGTLQLTGGGLLKSSTVSNLLTNLGSIPSGGLVDLIGASVSFSAPLQVAGTLRSAGTTTLTATAPVTVTSTGVVDAQDGAVTFGSLVNNGTLLIGDNAVSAASYQQGASGTLDTTLAQAGAGRLTVTGAAALAGTFQADTSALSQTSPFTYSQPILSASNVTGAWTTEDFTVTLDSPRLFSIEGTNTLSVEVTEVGAPTAVTLGTSTPAVNTGTVTDTVTVTWTAADDADGSGVAGYRAALGTSNTVTPSGAVDPSLTRTSAGLAPGSYWIAVQAVDKEGNEGPVVRFGPFVLNAPVVTQDPTPQQPTPQDPGPQDPPKDTTAPTVGVPSVPTVSTLGVVGFQVPVCPASETTCTGTVKLTTTVPATALRAKTTTLQLGTLKFSVKGGQKAKLTFKLTAAGRKALKKLGKITVKATITVKDASGNQRIVPKTIVIKKPRGFK